jgi:predicted Zn-dependent peptidase
MKFKKTILKNGLRVVTVPMPDTQTATVVVMAGVGSRYETEKEAGLSHFIEHMFFKGTEKRPSALVISETLDSIGGEFNAVTLKDRTGYYAKVDCKHIDVALDVIADIFLNSKIEAQEIEREKGTIIQELNMYEDDPRRNIGDVFERLLYVKNFLGRPIIGYKKTIQSFERRDFINYIRRFYTANNTIVCVAGKIDEKNILHQVRKKFSLMNAGKKLSIWKNIEDQKYPALKIKIKKTDQTHLILGNRAYHQNHKDRFVLALLAIILGGNMSSRLFIEVRERRGLAYAVSTFIDSFRECGYLATQAGVDHGKLEETIKIILREYKKIATEKVSVKELQKAKDYIKGKSLMGLEASDEVAVFHVDQELARNKIISEKEIFARIDKITTKDILRVARDIFRERTLNLAVIGPHRSRKKLQKILTLAY